MRRAVLGLFILALLAPPAFAQGKSMGSSDQDRLAAEAAEKKRDADALEKQYKSTLQRTRQGEAPARNDPWANMRGSETTKR